MTLFFNGSLVVMMVITKRRTPSNPRPDDFDASFRRRLSHNKPLLQFQEFQDVLSDTRFLEVKMSRKIIEQAGEVAAVGGGVNQGY